MSFYLVSLENKPEVCELDYEGGINYCHLEWQWSGHENDNVVVDDDDDDDDDDTSHSCVALSSGDFTRQE